MGKIAVSLAGIRPTGPMCKFREREFTDGGGLRDGGHRLQRYLIDGANHRYFGYDLALDPAEDANR